MKVNINSETKTKVYKLIFSLIEKEFNLRGYNLESSFDYKIWFLNQSNSTQETFKDFLQSSPSETDDIIKSILYQAFVNSKSNILKVNVRNFIDILTDNLIRLYLEGEKIENIIESYNSYDIVTKLEQILSNMDSFFENNTNTKSFLNVWIHSIEGQVIEGDYLLSMIGGFIGEDRKVSVLEYKMNSFININEQIHIELAQNSYFFQGIEFYSFDDNIENSSGTNLSFLCLRCENLSSKVLSSTYSQRKPFLDILLANIKTLTNLHKKNKIFDTQLELEIFGSTLLVNLKMKLSLDPLTMSSIYRKILYLQKGIISYRVVTLHKVNTIINYFSSIEKEIKKTLSILDNQKKDLNQSGCSLF